jgi:transcriptional regulator PpsR
MTVPPQTAAIPFTRPEWALGGLAQETVAEIVTASSDVALVIDRDGVIRDLSVGSMDLVSRGLGEWIHQPWSETVTEESRVKVEALLRDARDGVAPRWREMNHPGRGDGDTLPVRYFAVAVGQDGRVIVIGRDLQATAALQQRLLRVQQSLERDYLRLRQAESRYRLLFHSAGEPVLIVDAGTRRVREANPAAARLIGQAEGALEGQTFASLLDKESVAIAQGAFASASSSSTAPAVTVRLAHGGQVQMSACLFRQDRSACLLVRLADENATPERADGARDLIEVLEGIPDAFVVADADLRILASNPAFADLVQLVTRDEARGQPLERFLGRPQIDLRILITQLKEHGAARNFQTVIRNRFDDPEEVEVSAVMVPGATPLFGFSIRVIARRMQAVIEPIEDGLPAARSVEQLTQLIGRAPMKDIVRESTDVIERLCIEAALKLTSNNRAAAADMLGLSRQSLYSKLNRFGLGGPDDD